MNDKKKFRVALSGDFLNQDGSPVFPVFDTSPLTNAPDIDVEYLRNINPIESNDLENFDALILLGHQFTKNSIPKSGCLSVVARFGVGYDSVDVSCCSQNDIVVCITPDGVRRPVAVSIMTLILALTGKLLLKDDLVRQGSHGFEKRGGHMGVGLVGKTLGSIGIGNIGAEMFRLALPFDMNFIAYDPYANKTLADNLGVTLVDLDELFIRSDIVVVNCPLSSETFHLVNKDRINLMKSGAYFINTARGPIVDQAALTEALHSNKIAGAGLDVFETEPVDAEDPLLMLDNVIVTPHALCWTDQCFAGIGAADVRSVLDIRRGIVPSGVVNHEVLESPGFRSKLRSYGRDFETLLHRSAGG